MTEGIDGDWKGVLKGGEDGGEGEPGIENIELLWFLTGWKYQPLTLYNF